MSVGITVSNVYVWVCIKGKWVPKSDQVCWEDWTQGVNDYDPSKAAIINRRWSLNVKISKVAMSPYECIILKWVNPQCKINSGKYVSSINCHLTKSSSMSGLCPSVSISKSNIDEKSTTNHTPSDQNGSLLLKVIVGNMKRVFDLL